MLFRTTIRGSQLKSVTLDGIDITDAPYDADRGGTDRLEIVLTSERQEVTGTVVDALGRPPIKFTVFVFPATLREGALPGRFTAFFDSYEGMFRISSLPPGNYFAAALASMDRASRYDPDFQETIKLRATLFQLLPGQTQKLELTLIE